VAVGVRAVAGEGAARQVLPFSVLVPAAVWAGVSADALTAAVGATGLALLAVAAARAGRPGVPVAVAGGAVLGLACLLSYGAVLLGVPAAAMLVHRRAPGRLAAAALAGAGVLGLVAVAGFVWWEGYVAVRGRYLAGFGGTRPYGYWVWADIAVLAVVAGPAVVAALGRLVALRRPPGLAVLMASTGAALLLATLSGMSKAEVERIWLPWTVWLVAATAVLPRRGLRWWLAAQAVTGLLLEHLLRTPW
jgi:hypothetical protein